ncbi:hypothetical protein CEP52_017891 [Fusarium oligoseptatum]|uniref:Uncharacterized protein n=1 Tax=Fusarium oligoseptatum TaxID=2604345 RepID=A0A428RBJ7_9HYPO|nr:hypothetical protein CEP52_017891 [Fusarium oligoseptatum]
MTKCSVVPGELLGLIKGRKMRNFFTHGKTPSTARVTSLVLQFRLVGCGLVAPSLPLPLLIGAVAEPDVTPSIMPGKHDEKSDLKEASETRGHGTVDRINSRGAGHSHKFVNKEHLLQDHGGAGPQEGMSGRLPRLLVSVLQGQERVDLVQERKAI